MKHVNMSALGGFALVDMQELGGQALVIPNTESDAEFLVIQRVSVSLDVEDVKQQGSHIVGLIVLKANLGLVKPKFELPFDISTGFANPVYLNLGTVLGVPVLATIAYDLPGRTITIAIELAGLVKIASKTFKF